MPPRRRTEAARTAPHRRFVGGADPRALGYREAAKLGYTLGTDRGAETPGPVCPLEYLKYPLGT